MVVGFRRRTWKESEHDRRAVPNIVDICGIRRNVREAVGCDGDEAMDRARVYRLH